MRISLGRRGDYSVRAVLFLARHEGRQKSRAIASAMKIPGQYLPQVMGALIRGGIVASTAGPGGGYELARAPRDVTLLEVVEAADGTLRKDECVLRGGPCHWEDRCAIHDPWSAVQSALVDGLSKISFETLRVTDESLERGARPPRRATGKRRPKKIPAR